MGLGTAGDVRRHGPFETLLSDELGRLTGVVVRLACALDAWPSDRRAQEVIEGLRAEWLLADMASGLAWTFSPFVKLRRLGEARFARAHRAYSVARGDIPCVVRVW